MTLSEKEKVIALVANGIAVYSLYFEEDKLQKNENIFNFILEKVPKKFHSNLSAELIDEVFEFVSTTHSS